MPHVHLVSRPAVGGIRTHLAGLLADLPKFGWEPIVHAPQQLLNDLLCGISDFKSYPLEIPAKLSFTDLSIAKKLSETLQRGDIVHAHGIRGAWICVIAKRFVQFRLFVTLHNVPPRGQIGRLALRLISVASDRIICVSNSISQSVNSPKCVVIPNGVDFAKLSIDALGSSEPHQRSPSGDFVVLCASRLSREKGIDLLLQAATKLSDVSFIIAGDGPQMSALTERASANVTFLGHRSDVPGLMRTSDCFVLPSRVEGQGIAVLEAFAIGTPVVATAVGGIPENVIDGETGLLIESENAPDLVEAIEKLRGDTELRMQLATSAGIWVRKHRQRESQSALVAAEYEATYGSQING